MKKSTVQDVFFKNAGYFAVILISVIYIAGSLITISKSGRTVYEILGEGALSLIVGIMINGAFRTAGIKRGDEDERTVATRELHARAVEEITPKIDILYDFCNSENKRAVRDIRIRILSSAGLKYTDFFDSEGNLLNVNEPQEKQKKKAYKKALRVKIRHLSPSDLTTDVGESNEPFDFGKSKRSYAKGKSIGDGIVKLVMAVIFGYFGVGLSNGIDLASLIWHSLQIILYISSGIIQMYTSYMWVTDEYRGSIIKKIDYLQKFKLYNP